jgi:septum site-determining protein MinD
VAFGQEKIYVVTSGKGGVGKTTVAANLGAALTLLGYRVALVDADTGLRNLDVVLGLENRVVYDSLDVARGRCGLEQALVRDKRLENLFLLPAAQRADKAALGEDDLKRMCLELSRDFDYVLVDSPAGIEHGFRCAARAAEKAVVVTTPDVAALRDADRVLGLLLREGQPRPWLAVNRVRPRLAKSGDALSVEDVLEVLADAELLGAVPEDEGVIAGANRGSVVVQEAGSPAGRAFRNMALRLAGEAVAPFVPGERSGFLRGILKAFGFEG